MLILMKEVKLFYSFTTYRWKFFNDHDRGSDNILLYRCLFFVGRNVRLSQNIMSFLTYLDSIFGHHIRASMVPFKYVKHLRYLILSM